MLSKIFSSLANRYITEKLLESEAFHRMAQRTHHHIQRFSEEGSSRIRDLQEGESAQEGQEKLDRLLRAVRETYEEEYGGGTKKR
ncbi:hypothetical protein BJ684DRAFT_20663 [Piptocephalis cylindrospora]|uniref:Uncharacterized protein n=1 Tax=Piptocephalis cylindrospora TaxID=1907219 RepID=A0A4P9Y1Y0_9FUNG|nr:hypothetical protein BJ684DRAFT_20663 [Piptocephalis cylindrospora]|eukprot:RKP12817.1 hypothetical protein BJ684DRAFT_20663 [Piptocephalis cylindrospora]